MNFLLQTFETVPAPLGFDTWLTFWLVSVISLINGVLMLFVGYKFLQILQLSGYKSKDYWVWVKTNKFKHWGRLVILSFLSSAALLVTNVLLEQFIKYKILRRTSVLLFLFGLIRLI
jgi:hypothetical protein